MFNVGDIKPIEVPLTFAMDMAWNINSIQQNSIPQYLSGIATEYFGEDLKSDIVSVWLEYDRLVRLRKHEHIDPESFSLLDYNEADDIVERWQKLVSAAESVHERASEEQKIAVWELVVHPVKASAIFTRLRVTQARNQLHARQRRNTANKLLRETLDLFDADFKLSEEFHSLLDGKWNHMMCQSHLGYGDTWHAPSRDAIFGLAYVQRNQNSNLIVGQMGVAVEGHEGVRAGRINEESERTHPSRRDLVPGVTLGAMSRYGPHKRWFDIFTRGTQKVHWKVSAHFDWVHFSSDSGILHPDGDDARVWITIDWDKVDAEFRGVIYIAVRSKEGGYELIHLPIHGHKVPQSFRGFVESDGCVSIPAVGLGVQSPYVHHPELGRGPEGSITISHATCSSGAPVPFMEYPVYIFSRTDSLKMTLVFNMTLDLDPNHKMSYEVGIDDQPTQSHTLVTESADKKAKLPAEGWLDAVMDCVWEKTHHTSVLEEGAHVIRVRLNHSNLLLEKIVLDLGGVKQSYLGPPTSSREH